MRARVGRGPDGQLGPPAAAEAALHAAERLAGLLGEAPLPDELVSFPGGGPASGPRADPGALRDESSERGWGAAVEGMPGSVRATGPVDRASVAVSAARAQSGDARTEYDEEAGLGACDSAPGLLGGGAGDAHDRLGA